MKRKIAALYDPYFDSLGGGEKHILSILKILEKHDCDIKIFWNQDLTSEIKERFNLQLSSLKFLPNIFQEKSMIKKLNLLKNVDYFFYMTDGSYFFSPAKKNFVFSMVPEKKLYPGSLLNKLKTVNYHFISNSRFTQFWLEKWGVKNSVIYPEVDQIFFNSFSTHKEKIILAVGRFFPQLHSKKQEIIIDTFNRLIKNNPQFSDWKLVLAGGLKKEDLNYFNQLQKQIKNNQRIFLAPNLPFGKLVEYYQKACLFWHFTGYEVDENQHPEMVEHLGITPLEAMAAGAITFCVKAGGPRELIKDGNNGFLFTTQEEIIDKTQAIIADENKQKTIIQQAKEYIKDNFSQDVLQRSVMKNIINS